MLFQSVQLMRLIKAAFSLSKGFNQEKKRREIRTQQLTDIFYFFPFVHYFMLYYFHT